MANARGKACETGGGCGLRRVWPSGREALLCSGGNVGVVCYGGSSGAYSFRHRDQARYNAQRWFGDGRRLVATGKEQQSTWRRGGASGAVQLSCGCVRGYVETQKSSFFESCSEAKLAGPGVESAAKEAAQRICCRGAQLVSVTSRARVQPCRGSNDWRY